MDLYSFVGKYVEIEIYRRKYKTKKHVRCFKGVLTDIGSTMLCLERKDGSYRWIPRPNMYKDKIKEIENE